MLPVKATAARSTARKRAVLQHGPLPPCARTPNQDKPPFFLPGTGRSSEGEKTREAACSASRSAWKKQQE